MQNVLLDFTDMTITEGGGSFPLGVMPATIVEAQSCQSSTGLPQIQFKVECTEEGAYHGLSRLAWINLQAATPDKQKGLKQIWASSSVGRARSRTAR
jgi:hypothetical protein